ncbi:hypothetical protein [Methyloversatilis sp.]|uniref:hypothetical protein n=1 Tax=Methyloversatilis sp. TaxID=2569862 RepID=UPI002734F05D|nr:hypothetical protein [Methyloversatilis sp.]MDP3457427.1 hypothetical protein [Methyloversatilis sp.]MDP3576500.1 hypothetical protein [Methyloversatilis sp.]
MHRSKWLCLSTSCNHKSVTEQIRSNRYNTEENRGFDISFRDSLKIGATFIEKTIEREIVIDPFGESTSIETTRYLSTSFHLHLLESKQDTRYALEILSPRKSIRSLIFTLSDVLRGAVVDEIKIPLIAAFNKIKKSSPDARIRRIKASSIKISEKSIASIDITSIEEADNDFFRAFGESDSIIERIWVTAPFDTYPHQFELSRSGNSTVDDFYKEKASDFILSLLKDA